jgi:hypothetical protein
MLGDIKKFSVVTRAMKESHDAAEVLDSVFS